MLSHELSNSIDLLIPVLPITVRSHPQLAIGFVCFLVAWITWRIWKFTLLPSINPDDPKELPYWVPILGHGIGFFNNSNQVLARALNYFGSRDPYALTIAGSKLYVITKSQDVAEAYRNTKTLSFNEFVMAMMRSCGNTESCVQKMYTPLPKDKEGFANPHGKPLATLAREMHIHQLFPGDNLDFLGMQFQKYFENHLSLNEMATTCEYAMSPTKTDIVMPLMEWCSDVFTKAGQRAYFGPALEKINPTLPKTFIVFDELSWQVLYQYPDFLAGEMKKAKSEIKDSLLAYIQTPQDQRTEDAWFTKAMENEMRALDISEDDIATMLVTIYWGINTNTRKSAFWMLTYILHQPELIDLIREEIKPAFVNGEVDIHYINDNCDNLSAMWNETIRMSAYSASVRFITQDTPIGGKILRKGNRLMIPYRQLHFDETVFGEGINNFQADRFLHDKNLTKSGNWRPFGGGVTQCPGRFVARQAVLVWVAMLLHRFDLEVLPNQEYPQAEEGKPVLGIMSNKDGHDLNVRVMTRKTVA